MNTPDLRSIIGSEIYEQIIAKRDYLKISSEVEKWEEKYQQALKQGCEALISEMKFRRDFYVEKAQNQPLALDNQTSEKTRARIKIYSSIEAGLNQVYSTDSYTLGTGLTIDPSVSSSLTARSNLFASIPRIEAQYQTSGLRDYSNPSEGVFTPETEDSPILEKLEVLEKTLEETNQNTNTAVMNAQLVKQQIQEQYEQACQDVQHWHQEVQQALQKDDDNLVLKALVNKKVQNNFATSLKTQLEQQEVTISLLKQNLASLQKVKEMLEMGTELLEKQAQLSLSPTS